MKSKIIDKQYLQKHRELIQEIADEQARLDAINENKGRISSPQITGMPHGSSTSDPTSTNAINDAELAEYINQLKMQLKIEKQYIEDHVRQLENPKHKQVIRLRYLSNKDWDDVLLCMFGQNKNFSMNQDSYSRRMYGLHRRAIEELYKMTKDIS